MPSFKIYTLGCKVNQYDSALLKKRLEESGFRPAEAGADLAVVNTCSVTKTAIAKDKRIISLARKENPRAQIVVMGCMKKFYESEAEASGADLIFGAGEIEPLIKNLKGKIRPAKAETAACHLAGIVANDRSRYFLKIQDGCEQYCAYCAIPYTRGKIKSRPTDEIMTEAEAAAENGYCEIVLSGIHLGQYGKDFGYKTDLRGLLAGLVRIKNIQRIRLSSIEVNEISGKIIALAAKYGKICPHFHVPLQAGTDKILKLMNRPYDTGVFAGKITAIRALIPKVAITTDVIVGFPGETAADFKKTIQFCKKMNFAKIHVFSFSAHKKTPAAKMKGKVPAGEIKRRSKALRDLSEALEERYKKKMMKSGKLSVVIERKRGIFYQGKTEYGFDVSLHKNETAGQLEVRKIIAIRGK